MSIRTTVVRRSIRMIMHGEDESKNDSGEEEYKDDNVW